jgi:membrane-associated phospholipid phosphatase
LYKRYGWQYGVPAYVITVYVAYDRVRSNDHYPIDVVAGAAIAFLSSYIFTTPYKGWAFEPAMHAGNLGIRIRKSF